MERETFYAAGLMNFGAKVVVLVLVVMGLVQLAQFVGSAPARVAEKITEVR